MKIIWQTSPEDILRVRALIHEQKDNPLVRRRKGNLAKTKPQVNKSRFWIHMVQMRLTSIQRSDPDSHVSRFCRLTPFPLSYERVCAESRPGRFIAGVLKGAGGIRFQNIISRQLAANLSVLENKGWPEALENCNRLTRNVLPNVERAVANYIEMNFEGFGPKQSRNLLQSLGLTRYEIPIDSRVTDWLNKLEFPVKLSAAALADRNYYEFVSDGVQILCADSEVYPCILDAAIFAKKDGDAWTDANLY
jgi:hypothetical protein